MRRLLLRSFAATALLATAGLARAQQRPAPVSDYVLGPGDVIKITVFQSPELSLDTRIPESGVISYPLLGSVQLGNLTVAAAAQRIADGLLAGKFLKQPQVSILVITQKGSQATVLGHVVRQGRYPLELSNTKLSDLLAMAGGVAPDGSDTLTVVGTRDGKAFRKQVDLRVLFRGGTTEDIVIQHNDVVYVDRMPQIYVYGEVQKPGALRLERGMTVLQAVAAAGGLTLRGTQRGIRVNRRGPDGAVKELTPGLQETLEQDDVVFVRESLF
ncbi:MAG: polysaccharide export protein EpsE [Burkholderiales bacterium]|nr:polysaccharide export protein EpsE [Burkholderiales bacterium]